MNKCVPATTLAILASAALTMGLGQTTLFAFLPLILNRSGLDMATVGSTLALGSGLFLLGVPLWGWLTAWLGRRRVLAIALLGFSVSHGLLWWQLQQGPDWAWQQETLLLGRVLYGMTVSALLPACQAWLAALSDADNRLPVLSRLSAGLNAGRLLGPALGAATLSLSVNGPFFLLAVCPLLPLLLLPLCQPATVTTSNSPLRARGWQRLRRWLAFALLLQAIMGLVQFAIGPWLERQLALDALTVSQQLGWLLSSSALLILLLQVLVIPRCSPGRGLLLGGAGCLAAACLLLALCSALWQAWLALLLLGTGAAVLVPAYSAQASLSAGADQQSAIASALSMLHTCGYAMAAAGAGVLYDWQAASPFWLALLLASVLAAQAWNVAPPSFNSEKSRTHHA